jgi:hypothetical protein
MAKEKSRSLRDDKKRARATTKARDDNKKSDGKKKDDDAMVSSPVGIGAWVKTHISGSRCGAPGSGTGGGVNF